MLEDDTHTEGAALLGEPFVDVEGDFEVAARALRLPAPARPLRSLDIGVPSCVAAVEIPVRASHVPGQSVALPEQRGASADNPGVFDQRGEPRRLRDEIPREYRALRPK